jgi:hypothetical protein
VALSVVALSAVVGPVAGGPVVGVPAAASEDSARGRVRAAAHVTAIEEARCSRMPLILDIVTLICPSGM